MKHEYEVIVGNVGSVHHGYNKCNAKKVYREYVETSKSGSGRAGDEPVTLMKDGEIYREHEPPARCEPDPYALTKEEAYDADIAPLMAKILDVCKANKIAMIASFAIPNEDDPDLACTSGILLDECDPPRLFREIMSTLNGSMSQSPAMITVRDGDGKIKSMTAVLP